MTEKYQREWTLTLLHTNDGHGHLSPIEISNTDISSQLKSCPPYAPYLNQLGGYALLSSQINKIRETNDNVLLVETGDVFCDSELANLTKGKLHVKVMNHLKYDAMAPGNHDVDYGIDELIKRTMEANFPILAANMINKNTGKPLLGKPYTVKEVNQVKIGIYGLTYHLTHETTSKNNIDGVSFTFSINDIQTDITNLRDSGVDVIIVLSHLGSSVDRKLAKEVSGIDIIVGGHSHEPIPIEVVNNVFITQSTPYYTGLGVLKLKFCNYSFVDAEGYIQPISPKMIDPDSKIEQIINEERNQYKHILSNVIGSTLTPIVRSYKQESSADTLFGNILRYSTNSAISLLPGVGFGVTIPAGPITSEQLTNLLPHQSSIYTVLLKGRDILAALHQSIVNQINPAVEERVGGLIQVTGLTFTYQYAATPLIVDAKINDQPIQLEQYYQVVMNQLMVEGGHKYKSLTNYKKLYQWKQTDKEIVSDWLKKHPNTNSHIQGWSRPLQLRDLYKFQKYCFPYNPL